MGLFTALLTAPLAPVRGVMWVAEQTLEQAEREYYDPATIRRRLEEIDVLRERDEIAEEDAVAAEEELVERLLEGNARRAER